MRAAAALKYDILFQLRHGFHYAYLFIGAVYILILRGLPPEAKNLFLPVLVFTDPAVLGFFFIGGIVLLEKDQKTLESLFVTPLKILEYIGAKTVSLTFMALAVSFIISFLTTGFSFNPVLLFVGISLSSIFFILLGLIMASRFKSLNEYFVYGGLSISFIALPILDYFGIVQSPLFFFLPPTASFILIKAAYQDVPPWLLMEAAPPTGSI